MHTSSLGSTYSASQETVSNRLDGDAHHRSPTSFLVPMKSSAILFHEIIDTAAYRCRASGFSHMRQQPYISPTVHVNELTVVASHLLPNQH